MENGSVASVTVVGAGSAGLISALMIRRLNPDLPIRVLYSSRIGHIMIGEGTFANTPVLLHERAGLDRKLLNEMVNPTPKLGTRFLWGARGEFHYSFEAALAGPVRAGCTRPLGYAVADGVPMTGHSIGSALMEAGRLMTNEDRLPPGFEPPAMAYHMENEALVAFLTRCCTERGIELVEAELTGVETGESGVERVVSADGRSFEADLFVDCSGFAGRLIHGALGEPHIDMRRQLFCDKAVVGGWKRGDEPLNPFTTVETMDAGWCWRIEHAGLVNRGYVYSSAFIEDDAAEAEFRRKNPKVADTRVIRFESRHVRRSWVGNVVAIGNADGFVEPLESTNLQVICIFALRVGAMLSATRRVTPAQVDTFNVFTRRTWNSVRDFLALHYAFNYLADTPFWRNAREDTPLGGAEDLVAYYREIGPDPYGTEVHLPHGDLFGAEGYLTILLGCGVPYARHCAPDAAERARADFTWRVNRELASRGSDPARVSSADWTAYTTPPSRAGTVGEAASAPALATA